VSSTTPASSRLRGSPPVSRTAFQASVGYVVDGGAFPRSLVPADAVVHPVSGPGVEGGDVVDQAVGGRRHRRR
jgi:hypothetical protein